MRLRPNLEVKTTARVLCCVALAWAAFCCVALYGGVAAQEMPTPQESRGKQIYVQGTSSSGKEILAYVGEASIEVPGSAMACANCHGFDGQGKPEGGIVPSNLTWETLTKPYGLTHADGRRHPPYTERALELAITRGLDPAGNKLLNVMPRYTMSGEDLADLVAYLKQLGRDRDPGISEGKIVIGTIVPSKGPLAETGQAIRAVTAAFFNELNSQGGIYSRRFELKFAETADTPAATRANFDVLLRDDQVFAVTGAFIAGAEKEVIALAAERGVPLVGPFTLYTPMGLPPNRQVFYLLSGLDAQARALVEFAAGKPGLKNTRLAVVYPQSEINVGLLDAIKDQSKKEGLNAPQAYDYAAGHFDAASAVRQLREAGRDAVLLLGGGDDALSFMNEAAKQGWFPTIFMSGAGSAGVFDAPAGFEGKIFLSFPTSPADQSEEGLREFRALANKYNLPPHHLAAQLAAYSAAKILVEALRRSGKDVSREKLINSLEGFYDYQTGLTPAITYGPNRRVGAMGAYVVAVELKAKRFAEASGWIKIN